MQAKQLLKLGIFGFLFDFWTWFFDGNCATYIQALPNFTNTINAMPNLGYKCASLLVVPIVPNSLLARGIQCLWSFRALLPSLACACGNAACALRVLTNI